MSRPRFDRAAPGCGAEGRAAKASPDSRGPAGEESPVESSEGALEGHAARAARRYLDLLRDALLDQHYLENELRIQHLLECVGAGREADPDKLANPARHMVGPLRRLKQERQAGQLPGGEAEAAASLEALAYAQVGRTRLDHLESCLAAIRDDGIAGDLVECGPGRGGAAIFMRGFLESHELVGPHVWVADRFEIPGAREADGHWRLPLDVNAMREGFARFGLLDDRVSFLQGPPARTLAEASLGEVALLRVDGHDPDEVTAILDAVYDRVAAGGFVIVDDYGAMGCGPAVDRFRSQRGVVEALDRVDWSAAAWRKAAPAGAGSPTAVSASGIDGAGTSAPATATKDLSVVVVVHNMRREAARTLHSLSRAYQRGVEDLDYEVIVVENGSDPEQRLGAELVRSFGEGFRYIDLGEEAAPSPAPAANRGISTSSGRAVALMIDGAHMLTPGVLRLGMLGLSTYAPAIVTARQWYVGPGQQPQMVAGGYGRELEDRLLAQIDWPTDGYRLFEVGHFIGNRDWFDGEWESNCIFVPGTLLEQVGGMDESFSMPGGGFVNLDFFERMVGSPGVNLVTILGEGSFHQVHGGTTTNLGAADELDGLVKSYEDHFAELRGRRFQVPPQRAHYVGSLPPPARRTRARRMSSAESFRAAHAPAADRRPVDPMPVPEELGAEFSDAFWRSGEWHRTMWLGRATHKAPTDLLAYQELIFRLRPDWVVETRTGAGGRALFLASICDLIDNGRVLSIDDYPLADPPDHPRIAYLRGDPAAERSAARASEIVGARARALVILGAAVGPQMIAAFRNYAPLVPVGSYVVVEETILATVWPGFGSTPAAAVQRIVDEGDFARDLSLERFALSFNAGGFLRRIR
ncbi:MAG: glycosyltransferase [Solirubrobacterales bacterium]|nr:glycosyltransferase [Solirubrobacterales bacterium]